MCRIRYQKSDSDNNNQSDQLQLQLPIGTELGKIWKDLICCSKGLIVLHEEKLAHTTNTCEKVAEAVTDVTEVTSIDNLMECITVYNIV